MENTENIVKDTVDTAMEAVKDIDMEPIQAPVIHDAGIGKFGKACLLVAGITAATAGVVATVRFIAKKVTKAKNSKNDSETATVSEEEAIDVEYTDVVPDEE